ncbi:coilin isoform X1 [Leptopilina heterotoma]|uniref:coilin isoform X1 n=1 Tax=Leptopilina heterotoma TaxID=63436 RepID=UPI001CA87817|nr:coilin isoform X1 [Leptopilina heterotoma]
MDKTKVNFRVKVDLSKFFQDIRKISWIFVDTSRTSCIKQLKDHIAKVFDIQESFYLSCESTYLPCKEDVRIVQYDNLITLMPGTSVVNNDNNSVSTFDEKEVQTDNSNEDANMTVLSGNTIPGTTTNNTMYHSLLEESEAGSPAESKETDSMMTEDYSFDTATPAKRKRSRRKRIKRLDTSTSKIDKTPLEDKRKPKIIDQIVLGSGKHIRFSNQDEEIKSPINNVSNTAEFQNKCIESPISKTSSSNSLDALLSLKQCSTPLTFSCAKVNKQVMKPSKMVSVINEDVENLTESDRNIVTQIEKSFDVNFENVDVEKCPPLLKGAQVRDIIAFKMFKMGENYTPQISNFIFGRVVDSHPITKQYTIQILRGLEEIEEPKGKLTLPTDEEETQSDIIKVYENQLLETRLISRKE